MKVKPVVSSSIVLNFELRGLPYSARMCKDVAEEKVMVELMAGGRKVLLQRKVVGENRTVEYTAEGDNMEREEREEFVRNWFMAVVGGQGQQLEEEVDRIAGTVQFAGLFRHFFGARIDELLEEESDEEEDSDRESQ